MSRNYKSDIFRAIHEGAAAMYEVGAISDEEMREYDRDCLAPKALRASFPVRDAPIRRPGPIAAR
jgi:DNA-binding transcriptional regulator YiaG